MIKKFICFFVIFVVLLSGCNDAKKVENTPTEGLEFTAENGNYVVSSYSGDEVNVIIPDTYNDIPVTVIGEDCFADSDIQSVRIGKNIVEIRAGAFYNASMLKEINIPASVKVIGIDDSDASLTNTNKYGAFRNCVSLEKVVFDEYSTFEILGYSTFEDCIKLKEIVLPETTKYIGTSAFSHCDSLLNINIPVNVTYMGLNVFFGFSNNQTINIYSSMEEWLYTTAYDYNGIIIDRTWKNNCDAVINYCYNDNSDIDT